jgi:hypothetical protein
MENAAGKIRNSEFGVVLNSKPSDRAPLRNNGDSDLMHLGRSKNYGKD